MAFRTLQVGEKIFALGVGAAAVGFIAAYRYIPYQVDMYKTLAKVYEIPRFKRQMVVEAWKTLEASSSQCLLKKHLTQDVVDQLKNYKTKHDANLLVLMKEALAFPKSQIGINAPDPFVYDVFRPLLDPIIAEVHNGFGRSVKYHPATYWGEEQQLHRFEMLHSHAKYVTSIRLECHRNLKYFVFNPSCSETDFFHFEALVARALKHVADQNKADAELQGEVHWFRNTAQDKLNGIDGVFTNNDERLQACGCYNSWPIGRGVFLNKPGNLFIQMNQEEHLKLVTTAQNADLKSAFKRLAKFSQAIADNIPYARHDRLGNPAFSLNNLGTGLKVSYELQLPKLSEQLTFKEIVQNLNLALDEGVGSQVTVSNAFKLGLNEYETALLVHNGVKRLIEMEEQL